MIRKLLLMAAAFCIATATATAGLLGISGRGLYTNSVRDSLTVYYVPLSFTGAVDTTADSVVLLRYRTDGSNRSVTVDRFKLAASTDTASDANYSDKNRWVKTVRASDGSATKGHYAIHAIAFINNLAIKQYQIVGYDVFDSAQLAASATPSTPAQYAMTNNGKLILGRTGATSDSVIASVPNALLAATERDSLFRLIHDQNNWILNGGFEQGTRGWDLAGTTNPRAIAPGWTNMVLADGQYVLSCVGGASSPIATSRDTIYISTGDAITYGGKVRTRFTTAAKNAWIGLYKAATLIDSISMPTADSAPVFRARTLRAGQNGNTGTAFSAGKYELKLQHNSTATSDSALFDGVFCNYTKESMLAGDTLNSVTAILANGVTHGGSTALLSLQSVTVSNGSGNAVTLSSTGSNGIGLAVSGNGSGAGISSTGGATGSGMALVGGGTSGTGLNVTTTNGNGVDISSSTSGSIGMKITGAGTGEGMKVQGGVTGVGLNVLGGASAGTQAGMTVTGGPSGVGLLLKGGSTTGSAESTAVTLGYSRNTNTTSSGATMNVTIPTVTTTTTATNLTTNNDKTGYTLTTADKQAAAQVIADTVWKSVYTDRNAVASSWGHIATNNDNTVGWAQSGAAASTDSGLVARIMKRVVGGGTQSLNGSDSLTVAQKLVTTAVNNDKTGYALSATERTALYDTLATGTAENLINDPGFESRALGSVWYQKTATANIVTNGAIKTGRKVMRLAGGAASEVQSDTISLTQGQRVYFGGDFLAGGSTNEFGLNGAAPFQEFTTGTAGQWKQHMDYAKIATTGNYYFYIKSAGGANDTVRADNIFVFPASDSVTPYANGADVNVNSADSIKAMGTGGVVFAGNREVNVLSSDTIHVNSADSVKAMGTGGLVFVGNRQISVRATDTTHVPPTDSVKAMGTAGLVFSTTDRRMHVWNSDTTRPDWGNIVNPTATAGLSGTQVHVYDSDTSGVLLQIATGGITSTTFDNAGAGFLGKKAADSVWQSAFAARNGVANSFGQAATTNLNTLGWAQTGAAGSTDTTMILTMMKNNRFLRHRSAPGNPNDTANAVVTATASAGAWIDSVFVLDSTSGAAVGQAAVNWYNNTPGTSVAFGPNYTNSNGKTFTNIDNGNYTFRIFKTGTRMAYMNDTAITVAGASRKDTVRLVTASQLLPVVTGKTNVYGYVQDILGDSITDGVEIEVKYVGTGPQVRCCTGDTSLVMVGKFTAVTRPNDNGRWEFNLYPSTKLVPNTQYQFTFRKGQTTYLVKSVTVPDQANWRFRY